MQRSETASPCRLAEPIPPCCPVLVFCRRPCPSMPRSSCAAKPTERVEFMMLRNAPGSRRGAILPFMAFALLGLCGMVALAVDVGMILVARVECQSAADLAA